jgi:orotate phosphoribosyltransferase
MDKNDSTKDIALRVASDLLKIEAIRLNKEKPFSWSSGWTSPIYCDNRMSLSFPDTRSYIKKALANACRTHFPSVESIAGVATAGIPQGALVADALEIPFIYVRSSPKGHGMENLIEGKVSPGQKVVLVEDLISTGGSSLKAAEALIKAGYEVLGMLAIFTYGFPLADDNFAKAGIKLHCLSNYSIMLEKAKELGYVNQNDLASLEEWRKDPSNWKG